MRLRHNMPMTQKLWPGRTLAAVVLVLGVALSGCGSDDEQSEKDKAEEASESASASVSASADPYPTEIPGVTFTDPGETFAFGEPIDVAWEPNSVDLAAVTIKPVALQTSTIADLSDYELDANNLAKQLFYLKIEVKNLTATKLGGVSLPIYLQSAQGLNPVTDMGGLFRPCPSNGLPAKKFGKNKTVDFCQLYLVAPDEEVTDVVFQPTPVFDAITWDAEITKTKSLKAEEKKARKKAKREAKKQSKEQSKEQSEEQPEDSE